MRRLLLGLALASVTAFAPIAVQAGDQEIASHIEQKLREANQQGMLKNFDLDMQVSKGVVWFKGKVASKSHERLILTTAQQAKHLGVVKIIDEIGVQDATTQAATKVATRPNLRPTAPKQPTAPPKPVVAQTQMQQPIGTGSTAPQPRQTTRRAPQNEQAYYNQQAAQANQVRQTANYAGDQVVLPPQRMAAAPQPMPQPMGRPQPMSQRPTGRVAQNVMPAGGMGMHANLQAPNYTPVSERRAAAQYDHAQMPNYAWPSYAQHPNYGAVSYPKQYSPSAWPYIGPFYPYPQVPLGWRKVTMEWDDGWWYLDFHDH